MKNELKIDYTRRKPYGETITGKNAAVIAKHIPRNNWSLQVNEPDNCKPSLNRQRKQLINLSDEKEWLNA